MKQRCFDKMKLKLRCLYGDALTLAWLAALRDMMHRLFQSKYAWFCVDDGENTETTIKTAWYIRIVLPHGVKEMGLNQTSLVV